MPIARSLSSIHLLGGIVLIWAWKATFAYGQNHITPNLPLSFFFDWDDPTQPVPVPVTEQCETIHIKWSRGDATGPNPTAPYYLQVYTSAFIQPFVIPAGSGLTFDWAVPFNPGTLYQICMFDKFGNTGGCQATYTVIPSSDIEPTCANITKFAKQLDVNAQDHTGPLSMFGFVDQCTDISVTPVNGNPPYILTVAPALHPPYNITSHDNKPINWTVSLSWASPFFISLLDANGSMWSNGPLHSGGGGTTTTECLTGFPSRKTIKPSVAVGTGFGGLAAGLIIGALVAFMFLKRRLADRFLYLSSRPGSPETAMAESERPNSQANSDHGPPSTVAWSPIGSISSPILNLRHGRAGVDSTVRPFMIPEEDERTTNNLGRTASASASQDTGVNNQNPNQVYVIHHDSAAAPVTIYHQSGTEIVELPPRYPRLSTQNEEPGDVNHAPATQAKGIPRTVILNQPRRPGEMRKTRT